MNKAETRKRFEERLASLGIDFSGFDRQIEECILLAKEDVDVLITAVEECVSCGKRNIPSIKKYLKDIGRKTKKKAVTSDETKPSVPVHPVQMCFNFEESGNVTVVEGVKKKEEKEEKNEKNERKDMLSMIYRGISLDEAFAGSDEMLRPYQPMLISDFEAFAKDEKSKMTIFNPTTSIGKTYLIPMVARIAIKNGSRLIYSCSTIASINEVYKEFAADRFKGYFTQRDPVCGWQKCLLIPALQQGLENFLSKDLSYEPNLDNKDALPRCTKKDINALKNFLEEMNKQESKESKRKSIYENLVEIFNDMHWLTESERPIRNVEETLKKDKKDLEVCEKCIRDLLYRKYQEYMDACKKMKVLVKDVKIVAKENLLRDMPWVGKMYPGVLYDHAEVVLVTNKKLSHSIDPVFKMHGKFLSPEKEDGREKNWVLVDEVDQFCDNLLSDSTENSFKIRTGLIRLLQTIYQSTMTRMLDINQKDIDASVLKIDRELCFDSDKRQEEFTKDLIELYKDFKSFDKEYFSCLTKTEIRYNPTRESDGGMSVPSIIVDENHAHLINRYSHAKNDKATNHDLVLQTSPTGDAYSEIVVKAKPVNADMNNKETEEDYLFTKFCQESSVLLRRFIALIRRLCDNYQRRDGDMETDEARRNVCGRFKLYESQQKYVIANMLDRLDNSVPWDHFYAYGFTWNMIDASNNLETQIMVTSCNNLPDSKFATLVLNSKKTILCSATANLKSQSMPDVNYVAREIVTQAEKMQELEYEKNLQESFPVSAALTEADVVFKMPHIQEASDLLKKERERQYADVQKHAVLYDREGRASFFRKEYNYPESKADAELFMALTGIQLEREERENYGIQSLAFATFAMDTMVSKGIHTGIVYSSRLPEKLSENKNKNYVPRMYSEKRCREAARAIEKKYGLPENSFEVIRFDTKSDKNIVMKPGHYLLLLSAYRSTGAGSNISVRFEDGEHLSEKRDIASVFCDDYTNIIAGSDPGNTEDEKTEIAMQAVYYARKQYELIAQTANNEDIKNSLYHTWAARTYGLILPCIQRGDPRFKRDLYENKAFSVAKETIRKSVLQAVNRIERGHVGERVTCICLSDTLINKGGIHIASYRDTNLGYLFENALKKLDSMKNTNEETISSLIKLNAVYMDKNRRNRKMIENLVKGIERAKKNEENLSALSEKYDEIRRIACTGGWGENIDAYTFFSGADSDKLRDHYMVKRGTVGSDERMIDEARLVPVGSWDAFDIRPAMQDLRATENNGWLGNGWEEDFKDTLPYRENMEKYGYKFLPYPNMHDIFIGAFYENLFFGISRPNGVYHIDNAVLPFHECLKEDFDFYFEGTHVVIDVKRYRASREPSNRKKLEKKIKRYEKKFGRKPVVVFLNMASKEGANQEIEDYGNGIIIIHAFSDPSLSKEENEHFFMKVRRKLRELCENNKT